MTIPLPACPRLSPAEERALLAAVAAGDREARHRMILANMRIVFYVARGFHEYGVPFEDLVGEGIVGLIRAVDKFDPSRERPFFAIAFRKVKSAIRKSLRRYFSRRPEPVAVPSSHGFASDGFGRVDDADELHRRMAILGPRERHIIARRHGLDGGPPMGLKEVAALVGVTHQRVQQIESRALELLRAIG